MAPESFGLYDVVRCLAGISFIVQAAVGAGSRAEGFVAGSHWQYRLGVCAVQFEIVLGLLLVSGLYRRLAWLMAVCYLAVLTCVSSFRGAAGQGALPAIWGVSIPPWCQVGVWICLLGGMVLVRPPLRSGVRARRYWLRYFGVLLGALAVGAPCGIAMALHSPPPTSVANLAGGDGDADSSIVILEPENWTGKALEILNHIDVGGRLTKGAWTVILYHHDCPNCRELLPEYEKQAKAMAAGSGGKFAFVEMPPYAGEGEDPVSAAGGSLRGRLSAATNWFAATPVVMWMDDGVVTRVASQPKGDKSHLPPDHPIFARARTIQVGSDKSEHDFGYVLPESRHGVIFELTGGGKAVRILKDRSECACMEVAKLPKQIPASGGVSVPVSFVAPKDNLNYAKRIVLMTDDPDRQVIQLMIKAAVGRPLELRPGRLDLGEVAAGGRHRTEFTVVNHGAKAFRPIYSTASGGGCIAAIPRAVMPPGGRVSIPVIVDAGTSTGSRKATVYIHTDCPDQPRLELPVRYEVVSAEGRGVTGASQGGESSS
ncbi:MAG: Ig-like domain-containing protein [Planctomycetota bacterium]